MSQILAAFVIFLIIENLDIYLDDKENDREWRRFKKKYERYGSQFEDWLKLQKKR